MTGIERAVNAHKKAGYRKFIVAKLADFLRTPAHFTQAPMAEQQTTKNLLERPISYHKKRPPGYRMAFHVTG